MSLQTPRSRVYIGLIFFTLLIVIPYLIGGLSGIVVALIYAVLFAAVVGLVKQIWRIPFLSHLQTQSPTLSLVLKVFLVGIIFIALILLLYVVFIPPFF
jgi:hypothetical protein